METDGCCTGIEGAGVGADDTLAEIGGLKALVGEVALDELGHGPFEEEGAGFVVVAEAVFDLIAGGRVADPDVAIAGRTKCIAQTVEHVVHGAPSGHVFRGERCDFSGAAVVVVPELNAGAGHTGVGEEGDEEAVDGRGPLVAAAGQVEFFNDERVEEAGEVGAGGHADAGEGFFDGAGTADAGAALNDQYTLAGAGEIGGAGETVVACADDDGVPAARGEVADGGGEADLAEDGGGGGMRHASESFYSGLKTHVYCERFSAEMNSRPDTRCVRTHCEFMRKQNAPDF